MTALHRVLLTIALVVWWSGSCRSAEPKALATDTRLLVIIVVDQLRSEYLDRYRHFWKEGFARLLAEGAVFERAAYPYLNTVTCPATPPLARAPFLRHMASSSTNGGTVIPGRPHRARWTTR